MTIIIGSTIIDFPNSSAGPNWAAPIIQFAKAVESALSFVVSPFDVGQHVMVLDSTNTITNIPVTDGVTPLIFPVDAILSNSGARGAFVRYTVYRETVSAQAWEVGELVLVYNNLATPKWTLSRNRVGDGLCSFTISDNGQINMSTTNLVGAGHLGRVTYLAQGLKQS